jgi:hypothetical protein
MRKFMLLSLYFFAVGTEKNRENKSSYVVFWTVFDPRTFQILNISILYKSTHIYFNFPDYLTILQAQDFN